jgi:hypothetical protein
MFSLLLCLKTASFFSILTLVHTLDYKTFTTEVTIPFDYSSMNSIVPFTEEIFTAIKIDTGTTAKTYNPINDTGTCGLIISASGFPDWTSASSSQHPVGWEFLSSSKRLYSGHWVPNNITSMNVGVEVISQVPILLVEEETICQNYNESTDMNICPTPTLGPKPSVTSMPTGIQVMGVGF